MARLCKERYVLAVKCDKIESMGGSGGAESAVIDYKFGPRYFAEFGRQQIVKSYFDTLGQPIDSAALEEAAAEEQEEYAIEENENGDGDGGGAAAGAASAGAAGAAGAAVDAGGREGLARRQLQPEAEFAPLGRKRVRK